MAGQTPAALSSLGRGLLLWKKFGKIYPVMPMNITAVVKLHKKRNRDENSTNGNEPQGNAG